MYGVLCNDAANVTVSLHITDIERRDATDDAPNFFREILRRLHSCDGMPDVLTSFRLSSVLTNQ